MAVPIQPTGWQYFHRQKSEIVPDGLAHHFYASWEDALWDLLRVAKIPRGSLVLVPKFFCGDVVENMRAHGLQEVWYPVDKNFKTDPQEFARLLQKHQPAIVVIFHAVGITNPLLKQTDFWKKAFPKNSILIEDSVHRLVDPADIELLFPRHVVMDSLRKVVPLAGSNLWGTSEFLDFTPTPTHATWWYQVLVFGWWAIFQVFLGLSSLPLGQIWHRSWSWLAERAMLTGYDIIGDHPLAGRGWACFVTFFPYLNREKIASIKKDQVKKYRTHLAALRRHKKIFFFSFPESDFGQLRGFPLGLEVSTAAEILQKLRQQGLFVRLELNDSPWAKKQKVVYLPLGPHLKKSDIADVAKKVLWSV